MKKFKLNYEMTFFAIIIFLVINTIINVHYVITIYPQTQEEIHTLKREIVEIRNGER